MANTTIHLERPVSVEFMVRPYIVKQALNNDRSYDEFHPSAWGSCLRKIAYQYYNEKEKFLEKTFRDVDPRMERIFANGHGTHHRWQSCMDGAGILRGHWQCDNPNCGMVYGKNDKLGIFNPLRTEKGWKCLKCGNDKSLTYAEVKVISDSVYNFKGSVDAIIDVRGTPFAQNNKYDVFVADLKTMKDEMFSALDGPKPEHVVQVHIYMWLLDLQGGVVVYENKDDQRVREEFVPRDESVIERIKAQAVWMRGLLAEKKLPFRPAGLTKSQFPCRFCEFVNICYK